MDYDDASEDTRVAGVETKAVEGNPYSVKHLEVDRSRSASHATDEHDDSDYVSLGGLDGASDYRGRGRGRGRGHHSRGGGRGPSEHHNPRYHERRPSPRGEKRHRVDDDGGRYNDGAQRFRTDHEDRRGYGNSHGHNSMNRTYYQPRGAPEITNHRPNLSYDDNIDDSSRRRRGARSRSRSRSPYRHDRNTKRRGSRSPYRRDRSRSPYRRERSRSPYRHGHSARAADHRDHASDDRGHRHGIGYSRNDGRADPSKRQKNDQNDRNRAGRRAHFQLPEGEDEKTGTDVEMRGGKDDKPIIDIDELETTKQDEDAIIEARRRRRAQIRAQFGGEITNDPSKAEEAVSTPEDDSISPTKEVPLTEPNQPKHQALSNTVAPIAPDNHLAPSTTRVVPIEAKADTEHLAMDSPGLDISAAKSPQPLSRQLSVGPDSAMDSPAVDMEGEHFAVDDVVAPEFQEGYTSINELGDHRRSDINAWETGAADYDEMMMQDDDRLKRLKLPTQSAAKAEPGKHAVEDEDDDLDMFSDSPVPKNSSNIPKPSKTTATKLDASLLVDDIDDEEGYLKFRLGEVLDSRYQVTEILGKGMFANVLRAKDLRYNGKIVAVKLLRNNAAMRKSGAVEIRLLQKLNETDPKDKMHIVRFLSQFDYKNHLSMVFENLNMNLRDVLKKFGRDVGLNIGALRSFAFQLFKGLHHLKACKIIHADLKPDNILVTQDLKTVKICDLGTAADAREPLETTSYLASRFYRAPEVILGMKYDYGIDMWAIGCTLYELYTGKILFTGRSNNQMLKMMMETKGHFSIKFLKKGEYSGKHFEDNGTFVSVETDPKTHKDVVRPITQIKMERGRDIPSRIKSSANPHDKNELKEAELLGDLVDRCLMIIPDRRFQPEQALKHAFIHRPVKNVPQPKFTPSALLGGAKHQTKPVRKRAVAADFFHEETAQSPTSAVSEQSPAPVSHTDSVEPAAAPPSQAPPRKGFKKVNMVKIQ